MIPQCYIPSKEVRNARDLARRHYFVSIRTNFNHAVNRVISLEI